MQNLIQSHLTQNREWSPLFQKLVKTKKRIYARHSYKEWLMAYKCRFIWDRHTHSVDGSVTKKEFGVTFNLILVKWDIEVHASILPKENLIKIRPLEWDSSFFRLN